MIKRNKSSTDSVRTPKEILQYVEKRWGKFYDPVPYKEHFDPVKDKDALKTKWGKVNFVNPPYSRPKWFLQKGIKLWKLDKTVSVFLVKNDIIGSKYFSRLGREAELIFFDRRVTFENYDRPASFSSMLVVFDGKNPGQYNFVNLRELYKQ